MKGSEIMELNSSRLLDEMVDAYRQVLESHGRMKIKIYIWEDGEIDRLVGVSGENAWLEPRSGEHRKLYHVTTIEEPNFDPWDCADHPAPEDKEQREAEEAEIIEWCVDTYKHNVGDIFDEEVATQERVEKYGLPF